MRIAVSLAVAFAVACSAGTYAYLDARARPHHPGAAAHSGVDHRSDLAVQREIVLARRAVH